MEAITPDKAPREMLPDDSRIREMEECLRKAKERRKVVRDQVSEMANKDPEGLADLIKSWID